MSDRRDYILGGTESDAESVRLAPFCKAVESGGVTRLGW
jgi:hypothetical protein